MPLPSRLIPLFDAGLRTLNGFKRRKRARGLLIVRSGGLGDTVLFAHIVDRFMALAEPDEPVVLLTPSASRKTTFLLPSNVEVIAVDYGRFRNDLSYRAAMTKTVYGRNFRRVISTDHLRHPLLDEALIAACAAPITEGLIARTWPKHDSQLHANQKFYSRLVDAGFGPSMLHRWTTLSNDLLGRDDGLPLTALPDNRLPAAEKLSRPTIVLQPYSAVLEKQPSSDLCLAIIDDFGDGVDIVITGGPTDRDRNPGYETLFERSNVRFDDRPFDAIVPLLRAATCVVSVDTALMHLAIAAGAPTVGLASAAYVGDLVPYPTVATPDTVRFLYTDMPCQGCLGACNQALEDKRWACVARLDAGTAIATIRSLMTSTKDAP